MKFTKDYILEYMARNAENYKKYSDKDFEFLVGIDYNAYSETGFVHQISEMMKIPKHTIRETIINGEKPELLSEGFKRIANKVKIMPLKMKLYQQKEHINEDVFKEILFRLGFVADYGYFFEATNNTIRGDITLYKSKEQIEFELTLNECQLVYKTSKKSYRGGKYNFTNEQIVQFADVKKFANKITDKTVKSSFVVYSNARCSDVEEKEQIGFYNNAGQIMEKTFINRKRYFHSGQSEATFYDNNFDKVCTVYRLLVDDYVISKHHTKHLVLNDIIPNGHYVPKVEYSISRKTYQGKDLKQCFHPFIIDTDLAKRAIQGDMDAINQAIQIYTGRQKKAELAARTRRNLGPNCCDGLLVDDVK